MSVVHLRRCASQLAIVTAMGFSTPAYAQEIAADAAAVPAEAETAQPEPDAAVAPAEAEAAPDAAGGEIVVTAQKRAENVQTVPISIAAFNEETLENANVLTVLDLPRVASNFQTVRSSNTGSTRIGIRGVGALANTLIEPSVAVFVDGVYVPRSGSVLGNFLDFEGVEVLRGPQGTLFGRNASVGALSLRAATPKNEFSGEIAAEAGSFDRYKLSGHVNVPLGENVAVRLAGLGQTYDGPWKNRLDGKTYGGSDDVAFRASTKAEFGNLEWIVRGDYAKIDGDGVANFDFDPRSVSPAALANIRTRFNGGPDTNLDDRVMNQFVDQGLDDENWGLSSTASLDFDFGTFRLVNSYREWTNEQLDGDILFFPVDFASRLSTFDSQSQNHELQFISPEKEWFGGHFDMVAGLYYFEEDFELGEVLTAGSDFCRIAAPQLAVCPALQAAGATTDQDVFQNVKSLAGYAQGNIHITDQLTLTLGGRYTKDKKKGTYSQLTDALTRPLRAPEVLTFPKIDDDRFTYRISVNYKPTNDIMTFANYSTGYKSGGYNSGAGNVSLSVVDAAGNLISTQRVFDRETVKNYELGVKSSWLDRQLKANLTFYRMDISGFQDRAFDGLSFVVRNAGKLRQQGFEFDTVISPVRNFSVTGSVAYLDSEFRSFQNASGLPGTPNTPQDLTGKPNTFSPEWTGNIAADWTGDLGSSGMSWGLNGNLSFVSDQFVGTQTDANPQTLADGYVLLGARATLNGADDRWSLAVFGQNLGNVDYRPIAVYQPVDMLLGVRSSVFPGSTAVRFQASMPRTYGVSGTFRF